MDNTTPRPLYPRETRYPMDRMLRGPRDRSGRVWKISPSQGFEPQTVQLVAIPYADYKKKNKGEN
jgi:hypothetical protein